MRDRKEATRRAGSRSGSLHRPSAAVAVGQGVPDPEAADHLVQTDQTRLGVGHRVGGHLDR